MRLGHSKAKTIRKREISTSEGVTIRLVVIKEIPAALTVGVKS